MSRPLQISLVSVFVIAGMLLALGWLMANLMLPADQRPPMAIPDVVRAAERCERDGGILEVATDVRQRPIMVTCLIAARED